MKSTLPPCFTLILLASGLGTTPIFASPDDGFERYQIILSRMPFGEPMEEPEPVQEVVPSESFVKSLRLCDITQLEGGPAKVAIVDSKTQKSFVLRVGETNDDGIALISADLVNEEAVLQKGVEVASLRLQGGTEAPAASKASTQQTAALQKTKSFLERAKKKYEDRRKDRRQRNLEREKNRKELAKVRKKLATPPKPKYSPKEMRQHLREYNVEAIKKGLPALPIELTPEEDNHLVAEGYLEPQPGQEHLTLPPPSSSPLPDNLGERPLDQMTTEELQLLEALIAE